MKHRLQVRHLGAVVLCLGAHAAGLAANTYYISSSAGNDDSNPGSEAQPWKTLDKINTKITLNPGDRVLFKSGDTWEGTLTLKDGVTYSRYPETGGTLPAPLISASTNIGQLAWSRYRGQIFVASARSLVPAEQDNEGRTFPAAVDQLFYKGVRLQRARYPNAGLPVSTPGAGEFGLGQNRFLHLNANLPGECSAGCLGIDARTAFVKDAAEALDFNGAVAFVKTHDYELKRFNVTSTDGSAAKAVFTWDPLKGGEASGLNPGRGYWLENKRWMLDAPGEWVYDATSGLLYVWLPDSADLSANTPRDLRASVHVYAARADGVANIKVQGLAFAESRSDAVAINHANPGAVPASPNIVLSNLLVSRAGDVGISIKNATAGLGEVTDSILSDNQAGGIHLIGDSTRRIHVRRNIVRRSGVGAYAFADIWMGEDAEAVDNVVEGASYLGITGTLRDTLKRNSVVNACLEFDDCGAIYLRGKDYKSSVPAGANTYDILATVTGNHVVGASVSQAPDRRDGVLGGEGAVKGIYLDDKAGRVTVDANFVSGFDYGVMLHLGRSNTITNNLLFGAARSQIWMQEDNPDGQTPLSCADILVSGEACNATNYLMLNRFTGNVMASAQSRPSLLRHTTDYDGTADFASYGSNQYAVLGDASLFFLNEVKGVQTRQSFLGWQQAGQDAGSSYLRSVKLPPVAFNNYSALIKVVSCPVTDALACKQYRDVKTGNPVAFPLRLPAWGSVILAPM